MGKGMTGPIGDEIVIHSIQEKVSKVRLLGYGEVEYTQEYGILLVKLPQELPTCYTNCLAIEMN